MSHITLRQLASELGVSATAVSMALRNHPRISVDLRRRAQALAMEKGYVPNPAWSRRSSQRRRYSTLMPLALVISPHPITGVLPIPERRQLEEQARVMGYQLNTCVLSERLSRERLAIMLWQTGVEAVLLGPIYDARLLELLPWKLFSAVAYGTGYVIPPCHWVVPDVLRAMEKVIAECLRRGYRRIALLQYREARGPADALDREAAILCARSRVQAAGGQFEAFDTLPGREEECGDVLRGYQPDAIIGQTPRFYYALESCGWPLGRDIGFATWMPQRRIEPALVSGSADTGALMAKHALRLLDAEVRAFERGLPETPIRHLIPMPWVEGNTLPFREEVRRARSGRETHKPVRSRDTNTAPRP